MSAIDSKYHTKIGGIPIMIARSARLNRHLYVREEAPTFVNKFSNGEPNYRDGSFFSHWAQLGWVNGFDQEFFEDGAKFFRSEKLDTSESTKLQLEKSLQSSGQVASGVKVNCIGALPGSLDWADDNYGYRQQITVTAPSGVTLPSGLAVQTTIDTDALETAGKVLANRADWKIYRYTGSSWVELWRDHKADAETWFPLQANISAGTSDDSYYAYYGYASETGNALSPSGHMQLGDYRDLLADADLQAYWKFESNGTDETSNNNDMTGSGTPTHASGKFSNGVDLELSSSQYYSIADGSQTGLDITGDISISAWVKIEQLPSTAGTNFAIASKDDAGVDRAYSFLLMASGNSNNNVLRFFYTDHITGSTNTRADSDYVFTSDDVGSWVHVCVTVDVSTQTINFYVNGHKTGSDSLATASSSIRNSATGFYVGATLSSSSATSYFDGMIDDLSVWSRILTPAQVRYIYNSYYKVYQRVDTDNTPVLLTNFEDTVGSNLDMIVGEQGSISGSPSFTTNGIHGAYMSFDGTDDYVTWSDRSVYKPSGSWTVEFMIKTTDTSVQTIFQSGYNGGVMQGIQIYLSATGIVNVLIGNGSGNTNVASTADVNDGNWHHVAVTYNGTQLKIYKDNALDTTSTPAASIGFNSTNYVVLGARNNTGTLSEYFTGDIDSFAFNNASARSSFLYGEALADGTYTVVDGGEIAKASAESTGGATIFVGCSDGKIYSWDGGTGWSSVKDTSNTSVNCVTTATFSNTTYLYFGSGDPTANDDGTAKLHRTADGSTFNDYTLTGGTTSAVLSASFYDDKLFVGAGPNARIYESDDGTTFSLSKDIDDPDNPGYPYAMAIYNNVLYVGGGSPEQYIGSNTNGFLWSYDGFTWRQVFPFGFTVVKSLAVYDFVLFIGTVNKGVYVFNTASVDKLFEFPWEVSVEAMATYDDKLMMALRASDESNPTGNEAIYVFDRSGIRHAFDASEDGFRCLLTIGSTMLIGTGNNGQMYRIDPDNYATSGYVQSSYFEASLPTIDKLYRSITLFYDELPTGCSATISWRDDESSSWTELGTADTAGSTSETFNFAVTATSKKISYKIALATTDSSKTPVIRKVVTKYVLHPDFKYIWKMTATCPDNIMWLDGTEPKALVGSTVTSGDSTVTLDGIYGMPDPSGDTMYAQIEDSSGNVDEFTYTGVSGNQLTGVPTTGDYALGDHSVNEVVRVSGKNLHQAIKNLKETKTFYTFTDIDGVTYTVLFHNYQTDGWVIDQVSNPTNVEENEVPITLLEA